jgi:predicted transcriptional regulator YdeE
MDFERVDLEPFVVYGKRKRFTPESRSEIGALWGEVLANAKPLGLGPQNTCYGMCVGMGPEGAFDYAVCVDTVDPTKAHEVGFEMISVPGGTFVMFTHHGPVSELPMFIQFAWNEGLPASAHQHRRDGMDFERYPSNWTPTEGPTQYFIPVEA